MKKRTISLLFLLLICFIICAGCDAQGKPVNPMGDIRLNMNVPITKAPNSFVDPNAPVVTSTSTANITVTPTSTYVFRYE